MPYVNIEIDLDEFDLDDIVEYLVDTIDGSSDRLIKRLEGKIKKLYPQIVECMPDSSPFTTYLDQKKYEAFIEGMQNKSLEEVESFFNSNR